MLKTQVFPAIAIAMFLCGSQVARAQDYQCEFHCYKMQGKSGGASFHEKTLSDCWVYFFWAKGQGDKREYKHFAQSPQKTGSDGFCSFKFKKEATYFLYFSGKELSKEELKKLATKSSHRLIKFVASAKQPSKSLFAVTVSDKTLRVVLNHSLPLWIALLQKVEAKVGADKPADVLTKTRKLFYDDANWDLLVSRGSVERMLDYDRKSGKILRHDLPMAVIEGISFVCKRVAGKDDHFKMDSDQERLYLERHDFVSLSDGTILQMGHVLTGFETHLFGTKAGNKFFTESVAAATWSGDLAQISCQALRNSSIVPGVKDADWELAVFQRGTEAEIAGDIIGAGLAKSASIRIKAKEPLSEILQDIFYDSKQWRTAATDGFRERYGFNQKPTPSKEEEKVIRNFIDKFASKWGFVSWETTLPKTKDYLYKKSITHLYSVLTKLESGKSIPAPTKPNK